MASPHDSRRDREQLSGWAMSGVVFAGTMLLLIGCFQMLEGIVAILDDEFYVVARNYTFHLDVTVWGWIHLLLGALMLATGLGVLRGREWAAVTGIVLALLSSVTNFFFIPYYPIWSLVVIGLNIWVVWALSRPGAAS
jgi:hypothetical protein